MPAAVMATLGWPVLSNAATLNVPADYPTIQSCINAAISGVDECVVAPGTYHETINFLGKAITLRSSGGRDVTTMDATGIRGSVVICASGEGPDTILDGFTITRGTGRYAPLVGAYAGGGMYNFYSSPTVTNCTFTRNTTSSFSPPYRWSVGGGMCNLYSSPMVKNCTFSDNRAPPSPVDDPGLGGGMFNYYSSPSVADCQFSGNVAAAGGGIFNDYGVPTVTNCAFRRNEAIWGSGGGIASGRGDLTVAHCMFTANFGSSGGGMYNGYNNSTVTNCVFSGNSAPYGGGGVANDHCTMTISGCTFTGNTANSYYGGGVFNGIGSTLTMHDCILWGNSPDQIDSVESLVSVVRYSDVQDDFPIPVHGEGNINLDPTFMRPPNPGPDEMWDGVDDDYGDLRLQAGSPCINAGDPAFVPQPGETDLDGHARVLCDRVDIGAFEFGIGDYDCNQTVNLSDFAAWEGCMTDPRGGELRMANGEERIAQPFDSPGIDPLSIGNRQSGRGDSPVTLPTWLRGFVAPWLRPSIGDRQLEIGNPCAAFDFNADTAVDLLDFSEMQRLIVAP